MINPVLLICRYLKLCIRVCLYFLDYKRKIYSKSWVDFLATDLSDSYYEYRTWTACPCWSNESGLSPWSSLSKQLFVNSSPLVPHIYASVNWVDIGSSQWLFGAKPFPVPMLTYCQLDHQEQTSVKFESEYKTFHSWKGNWKCRLWIDGWPFCPGKMS